MPKKADKPHYNINFISDFIKKILDIYKLNPKHQALRITLIYAFAGTLWVLLSDKLVELFIKEQNMIFIISVVKGWAYVLLTSILVYLLVASVIEKINSSKNKINEINDELEEKIVLLDKSNTLSKAILESSPQVIIFVLDNDYRYMTFNSKHKDTIRQIWGKEIEIGMNMLEVIGKHEDRSRAKVNFDRALSGESFTMIEEYGDVLLSRLYWQDFYSPIMSKNGTIIGLTCFVINITERKRAEEEILYLSYHDALTGLYNRRFYEEEIKRLDTERNLPISVIIGDVNGLKLVNDAFGHEKGDELLRKAAEIIQSACRIDDIVARWGGDEFVILLPNTTTEEAEKIVCRIRELYSDKYISAINVSISFGWNTKRSSNENIIKILKSAEDSMYKHKIIENAVTRGNAINAIIHSLHEKNPWEEQHSLRVSGLCQDIGRAMGFSEIEVSRLKVVGLLHDIGKIAIEDNILNKKDKLTDQEWNEIKRHSDIGYRIISSSYDMFDLADSILAHHERWDGKGYPKGLKESEIPEVARIITIADSYDAMTSDSSYHKALSEDEAITQIIKNAGTQFDPAIAKIFIEKVLNKLWE